MSAAGGTRASKKAKQSMASTSADSAAAAEEETTGPSTTQIIGKDTTSQVEGANEFSNQVFASLQSSSSGSGSVIQGADQGVPDGPNPTLNGGMDAAIDEIIADAPQAVTLPNQSGQVFIQQGYQINPKDLPDPLDTITTSAARQWLERFTVFVNTQKIKNPNFKITADIIVTQMTASVLRQLREQTGRKEINYPNAIAWLDLIRGLAKIQPSTSDADREAQSLKDWCGKKCSEDGTSVRDLLHQKYNHLDAWLTAKFRVTNQLYAMGLSERLELENTAQQECHYKLNLKIFGMFLDLAPQLVSNAWRDQHGGSTDLKSRRFDSLFDYVRDNNHIVSYLQRSQENEKSQTPRHNNHGGKYCNHCHIKGHSVEECFKKKAQGSSASHGKKFEGKCDNCGRVGHKRSACRSPPQGSQFQGKSPKPSSFNKKPTTNPNKTPNPKWQNHKNRKSETS